MNINLQEIPSEHHLHVKSAADWVTKFYPDIEIMHHKLNFELCSPLRSVAEIRIIWKSALVTQINHEASLAELRKDIEELVE